MGVAVLETAQSYAAQPVLREGLRLLLWGAEQYRPDQHVLQDRLPRKKGIRLEHVADAVGDAVDDVPADLNGSAARLV